MIKWLRTHKSLRDEIGRLKHQIKLMQEHIRAQKDENLSLKRKVRELEMLWDIEMKKRY